MGLSEEELEGEVADQLESNYDGRFGAAVDLDYEEDRGYMCVTFRGTEGFFPVSGVAKKLITELGIEEPEIRSELDPQEGVYELEVADSREGLPSPRNRR